MSTCVPAWPLKRRTLSAETVYSVGAQGLSSASNFLLTIGIAHLISARGLGAFAIVYATYLFFANVCRALSSEPLPIRYAGVQTAVNRPGIRGGS